MCLHTGSIDTFKKKLAYKVSFPMTFSSMVSVFASHPCLPSHLHVSGPYLTLSTQELLITPYSKNVFPLISVMFVSILSMMKSERFAKQSQAKRTCGAQSARQALPGLHRPHRPPGEPE